MLEQHRIAAHLGIEDADVQSALDGTRASVIAMTGVPSTWITGGVVAQTNSGSRLHVMPGARILWIVTMKLSPVRIDENPEMKIADRRRRSHWYSNRWC